MIENDLAYGKLQARDLCVCPRKIHANLKKKLEKYWVRKSCANFSISLYNIANILGQQTSENLKP